MSIEFEGFYDKKSLRKKTALVEYPSTKFLFRRLALALVLVLILIPLAINVYQTKQFFTKFALWVPILLLVIYYLIIQPYIEPYLVSFQASIKPKNVSFRKGEISSEGIIHLVPENLEPTPWSKIYRAKQTEDLVVLFVDYAPSMAFPRSFFKAETDWQQFRRWVDHYVRNRS